MNIQKHTVTDALSAYTLSNRNGMSITVFEFGATLTSLCLPGKYGITEATLGFNSFPRYMEEHPYFGSTVGRCAGRIARSYATLEGKRIVLSANEGDNHLHGGPGGFSWVFWKADVLEDDDGTTVSFFYQSADGEEGYPATVDVYSNIGLNENNELTFSFFAQSDATTILNLCNHAYWNLGNKKTVLDHTACIHADSVLEQNSLLIPTGRMLSVADTPFDFRTPKAIGRDIAGVKKEGGYDHCFVVRGKHLNSSSNAGTLVPVAEVYEEESGRSMRVESTLPGVQFYTANTLNVQGARRFSGPHAAFCLETQFFPDSVHHPDFPSVMLHAGEVFSHKTVHRFSW